MTRIALGLVLSLGMIAGYGCSSNSISDAPLVEADDTSFNALVLQSERPVLVDFWATWCGPCKTLAPRVAAVAKQYEGRVVVVKVDVDLAGTTAGEYDIQSIPTLVLFNQGEEQSRLIGLQDEARIAAMIDTVLQ